MNAFAIFNRRRTLLSLAALPLFAGCGGAFHGSSSENGREAAAHFLEELRNGRLETAWGETTSEFKSLMGLESLRDYAKARPALKAPADHAEAKAADRNGLRMVEHVFRGSTSARGKAAPATIKVLVSQTDGKWGVERVTVE